MILWIVYVTILKLTFSFHSHWMAIGSFVTILLLAFEPFLQTVVSLTGRTLESTGISEVIIARSEFLNHSTCHTWQYEPRHYNALYQFTCGLDLGLQSAYSDGLSNSSSGLVPFALCDAGNCTWTPFLSMDVCSSCSDITNNLKRVKRNISQTHGDFLTYKIGTIELGNFANDIGTPSGALWAVQGPIEWNHGSLLKQNRNTLLYSFQMIQAAKTFGENVTTWQETEVVASECALFFCVNLYQAEMRNGLLKEQVITSWSDRKSASYIAMANTTHDITTPPFENEAQFDFNHTHYLYDSVEVDFLRQDVEMTIPQNDRIQYGIPLDTKFGLSQNTVHTIGQVFNNYFSDDYYSDDLVYEDGSRPTSMLGYLYHSSNTSATVGNIAKAMSIYLRRAYGSTHTGVAHEWVICFEIQWAYLTIPIFSILLGISFCVGCMLHTRRLGLEPWKTDLIATLAHSTDWEIRDDLRNANVAGFLSTAASNIIVRFEDGADGPELRKMV
ncbi:putative pyridoxamine 5 -phosphate oxidase [Rosellinia necatrix]|uniref:Putative pyridoxamine 5-phosphate oxidase n=1 Tax=Rosellinia necatrix TaxID=77044 RepID=A0A1S7UM42_ROSNE|nr:putative pyridoxamine 5 -phosphate oxidase [Rosellinia necatrix]